MNFKQLINSFIYAGRGLKYAFKTEQNFRIQVFCTFLILILIVFLRVSLLSSGILVLLAMMVLCLELLNTLSEKIVDILEPRLHHYVGVVKDIMAAAVFIASLGALIVGILILWPFFVQFWEAYN